MSQLLHSLALVLCTDIQQFIAMKQKLEVEREDKGRLINRMYLSFMLRKREERGFTCISHILAQFLCGIHTFLELSNYFIKKNPIILCFKKLWCFEFSNCTLNRQKLFCSSSQASFRTFFSHVVKSLYKEHPPEAILNALAAVFLLFAFRYKCIVFSKLEL